MARTKGATAAQTYERVSRVYNLIVGGASTREIIKTVGTYGWGVEERAIKNYIQLAHKDLEQRADIHRDRELGKAVTRLESMYMRAMGRKVWSEREKKEITKPDLRTALQVLQELHRILGFHNPELTVKLTMDHQIILDIQSGEMDWLMLEELFGIKEATTYYAKAGLQLPEAARNILDMG